MSKSWSKQSYVSEFLNLKCAGDVLNVTSPIGNDAQKEITKNLAESPRLQSLG